MGLFDSIRHVVGGGQSDSDDSVPAGGTDESGSSLVDTTDLDVAALRERAGGVAGEVAVLDFSLSSLEQFDSAIDEGYDEALATSDESGVYATDTVRFGCYLGEVLVRAYDGEWTRNPDWGVTVSGPEDSTTVDVFAVAERSITSGSVFAAVADRAAAEVGLDSDAAAPAEDHTTDAAEDDTTAPAETAAEPTADDGTDVESAAEEVADAEPSVGTPAATETVADAAPAADAAADAPADDAAADAPADDAVDWDVLEDDTAVDRTPEDGGPPESAGATATPAARDSDGKPDVDDAEPDADEPETDAAEPDAGDTVDAASLIDEAEPDAGDAAAERDPGESLFADDSDGTAASTDRDATERGPEESLFADDGATTEAAAAPSARDDDATDTAVSTADEPAERGPAVDEPAVAEQAVDDWSTQTTADTLRETYTEEAEELVAFWGEYDLDYTAASLQRLDALVSAEWDDDRFDDADFGSDDSFDDRVFTSVSTELGSYFGEVLVRELGAEWSDETATDAVVVEGADGPLAIPVFKVAGTSIKQQPVFARSYDSLLSDLDAE